MLPEQRESLPGGERPQQGAESADDGFAAELLLGTFMADEDKEALRLLVELSISAEKLSPSGLKPLITHPDCRIRLKAFRLGALMLDGELRKGLLLAALDDESSMIALEALEELKLYPETEIAPHLFPFLVKKNPLIHQTVTSLLLKSRMPEVPVRAVEALGSGDPLFRKRALALIARSSNDQALSRLLRILQDPAEPAENIIEILTQIPSARAAIVWRALPALLKKGDRLILRSLAFFFKNVVNEGLITTLIKNLAHGDPRIRQGTVYLLGHLGGPESAEPAAALLEDPIDPVRIQAAWSLVFLQAKDKASRVIDYYMERDDVKIRRALLDVLWRLNKDEAFPLMLDIVKNGHYELRIHAIRLLCTCRQEQRERAAEALKEYAYDQDRSICAAAIMALIDLGARELPQSREEITDILKSSFYRTGDPAEMRGDAALQMAAYLEAGAIPLLREFLASAQHEALEIAVIDAIASIRSESADLLLIEMLRHSKPVLQRKAALHLASRYSPAAMTPLAAFLSDIEYQDDPAFFCITNAIINYMNMVVKKPLQREMQHRLLTLLTHRVSDVRHMAAFHLSYGGNESIRQAFALLLNSKFPVLRIIAALGLGRLGDIKAAPLLVRIFNNRELEKKQDEREYTKDRCLLEQYYELLRHFDEQPGKAVAAEKARQALALRFLMGMKNQKACELAIAGAEEKDPSTILMLLKAMASSASPAVIPALVSLKQKRGEMGSQHTIDGMLRRFGNDTAAYLAELSCAAKDGRRVLAARTMAEVREASREESLVSMMSDPYWLVRYWALKGSAALHKETHGHLFAALTDDPSYSVRILALQSLSGTREFPGFLKKGLKDSHPAVQVEAARLASIHKCTDAESELLDNISHHHYAVRMSSVRALGDIRSRKAFTRLKGLLKESLLPEKVWLYYTLTLLTSEKKYWIFKPYLKKQDDDRPAEILLYRSGKVSRPEIGADIHQTLSEKGFRAGPFISGIEFDELKQGNHDILLKHVRMLDKIYIERLSDYKEALFQAIEALGALAVPETISILAELLVDDREKTIKLAAMKALASTGSQEAYAAIVPALAAHAPEIHTKAAQLLKRADPALLFPHLMALREEAAPSGRQKDLLDDLLAQGR